MGRNQKGERNIHMRRENQELVNGETQGNNLVANISERECGQRGRLSTSYAGKRTDNSLAYSF